MEKIPFWLLREMVQYGARPEPEHFLIEPQYEPLERLVLDVAWRLAREDSDRWLPPLRDLICERYGLNKIETQGDLLATWDELFAAAVEKFRAELTPNDLVQLDRLVKPQQCFNWLGAKLRMGVAERVIARGSDVARKLPTKVEAVSGELVAELPACFVQSSVPAEWEELSKCARCLLLVIVRRSWVAHQSGLRYFGKGVAWLSKVVEYHPSHVRRGLKELREVGFIVEVAPAARGVRCRKYRVVSSVDELRAQKK